MLNPQRRFSVALLSLLASAALLSACSRDDGRTTGQKVDSAIAQADRTADQAAASAREVGREAKAAVVSSAETVASKSRDIAITTEVKTRLARDTQLSALAIDVDTSGGQVVLRGTAPDSTSRSRATDLARGVDGVTTVSNELRVQPR